MGKILDELVLQLDLESGDFRAGELAVVAGLERLTEIMEQVAAKFDDGGKRASESLDETGKQATKTGKEMEAAGKKAASFFSSVRTQVLALAGVSLSLTGLKGFVTSFAGKLNEMATQADAFGMSAKSLDGWITASRAFGISAAEITGAFSQINDAKARLASGLGLDPQLQMLMRAAGQAGVNINLASDSTEEVMRKLAQVFPKLTKAQQQAYGSALGMGYANQQWMASGHALRDVDKATSNSGYTPEGVAGARRLRRQWAQLEQTFDKLGITLEVQLLPYVERFNDWLQGIADWAANNPDEIRAKVDAFLKTVGDIAGAADDAAQAIGGWKNVIEAILALKLASWLWKVWGIFSAISKLKMPGAAAGVGGGAAVAATVAVASEPYIDKFINRLFGHTDYFQRVRTAENWSDFGSALLGRGDARWINGQWVDNRTASATSNVSAGKTLPRGIRNNNPGNLNFAGQRGATKEEGPNGRFAVFASMSEGISALYRQLQLYFRRGINTVSAIVKKYAPAADGNNVSAYISALTRSLGVTADQPLDGTNLDQMITLMHGIINHENGRGYLSRTQIAASLPQPGAQMSVQHRAAPAGSTVTQSTHIGTLNVTTSATNVKGITDDAHRKISRSSLAMNYATGVSG